MKWSFICGFIFYSIGALADQQTSTSTYFGEIEVSGPRGKRSVTLKNQGLPDQTLIQEEILYSEVINAVNDTNVNNNVKREVTQLVDNLAGEIETNGIQLANVHLQTLDWMSKGGLNEFMSQLPCADRETTSDLLGQPNLNISTELEFEVPKGFAERFNADKDGFFDMGEILSHAFGANTVNDNLWNGGGQALGLTKTNQGIEGDDRGLTFGLDLNYKAEFEEGSLGLEYFNTLYSRLAYRLNESGNNYVYRNDGSGEYFTENLVHEGVKVNFIKKLNGKYFMRLEGEVSHIQDQGKALDIQDVFHRLTGNNVTYEKVDHFDSIRQAEVNLGVGHTNTFYENGDFKLSSTIEGGAGVSNKRNAANKYNQNFSKQTWYPNKIEGVDNTSLYAQGSLDAEYKGLQSSIYGRRDTNGSSITGIGWSYTFNREGQTEVELSMKSEKVDNPFTQNYHNDDHKNELTHHLGITVKYKFGHKD